MNFKDIVENDIGIFLNEKELAEIHDIEGKQIPALIDTDALKYRPRHPIDLYDSANGVFLSEIVLYVRLSDLEDRPVVEQHMKVDGKLYRVNNCIENMGLLEINLEAYRS